MLIFYDWEFDAETNPNVIEPISLGAVTETGDEFYLVNSEFDWQTCSSQWLKSNVKPYLMQTELGRACPKNKMGERFSNWILSVCGSQKVQLVGYYSDYDHVCLAQRFGTMMQLPEHIPMYTKDLKQWTDDLGNPKVPKQQGTEHNALDDANHIRECYFWLSNTYDHPAWMPRFQKPRLRSSDMI